MWAINMSCEFLYYYNQSQLASLYYLHKPSSIAHTPATIYLSINYRRLLIAYIQD